MSKQELQNTLYNKEGGKNSNIIGLLPDVIAVEAIVKDFEIVAFEVDSNWYQNNSMRMKDNVK